MHIDETRPPKSQSTQIASVEKLAYAKVVLMDPRNTTAAETRMRYEVTRAPASNSTSHSFDKYSGRWIDNFAAKYHTRSTQSGLNSHKTYLGIFLCVSYDPRRKRLHKNQRWAFWLLNVTHTRKTATPDIHSRVMGVVTLPFWADTALTVPMTSGIKKTMKRYGDIFGCHRGRGRVGS